MEKGVMEEGFGVLSRISPCGVSLLLIGKKNKDCTALPTFPNCHYFPNSAVCDIMNCPRTYADLDDNVQTNNANGILSGSYFHLYQCVLNKLIVS